MTLKKAIGYFILLSIVIGVFYVQIASMHLSFKETIQMLCFVIGGTLLVMLAAYLISTK